MTEEVLFESEGSRTRGEIAQYLRAVADGLDGDGHLSLSAGGESVDLAVPERPTFEVKAERETGSGGTDLSVEFELEWDEGGEDTGAGGDLTIG
ncbi:amphi-Trp domain-containing protein [Halalkalicoccus sp. NIPERK01]|uniref:amphi-Trp domain-containing protein n=1 Tax=Halalkalicoccus sp. NIPERK01 TaxID=3053469 RepID=UPI00256F10DC|nr:amphi-Trp domain-containing protein [Halalkalicoccus sp. NIPERK01]MDL5363659.1 amphi-Trp domain-containing protein [Halalkalicoccus sp. NIPERK01]